MAQFDSPIQSTGAVRSAEIDQGLRAHMNKVYGTMSIGMLITAAAAWAIANLAVTNDPSQAVAILPNETMLSQLGGTIYLSPLRWVIMFGPLAFLFFGWGALMRRANAATVTFGFFAFAAVMGLSLSSIFLVYTSFSIVQVFLITAIAFAGLSLWGYTTKKDISAWGSFLIMGLIGVIVAMLLNVFIFQSGMMQMAIAVIGLLVVAGLTAWETQTIKTTYVAHAVHGDQEWLDKAAIDGAMGLYISFINMFQFLLMLLGSQE